MSSLGLLIRASRACARAESGFPKRPDPRRGGYIDVRPDCTSISESANGAVCALQKRKLLIQKGLPRQALLMTIVRDLNDQGHTILTVKTNRGDFILDNMTDEIRPWEATGYRFLNPSLVFALLER